MDLRPAVILYSHDTISDLSRQYCCIKAYIAHWIVSWTDETTIIHLNTALDFCQFTTWICGHEWFCISQNTISDLSQQYCCITLCSAHYIVSWTDETTIIHINGIPAILVKAWSLSRRNIVLVLPRFITLPCPPHLVRQLECFSLTDSVAKLEETCDEMSDFLEVFVECW